ncbi:hypothetical protein Franean1_7180 [Parafrankia sp. EAN1pec]|uniref:hypothetical protein n=1 Tax=Parafrankia sp. (strain EAN1pec) TaxID=298653 RepID=UPI000054136B|nr:hypothetical protein Franean1_7180 [Frankia sp. EAN1pec]
MAFTDPGTAASRSADTTATTVESTTAGTAASDQLARELAQDLGEVLGQAVAPADLLRRHDGAAAPVVGLLALASPRRRRTACQLAAEWAAAGSAEREPASALAAPVSFDFATLRAGGRSLVHGLQLSGFPDRIDPTEALAALVTTTAALAGAVREVVCVEPGTQPGFERIPGWVARLRLLAQLQELGPAPAGPDELGEWICATQENAASVYLPAAAPGSLWAAVMAAVRARAESALQAIGQQLTTLDQREVDLDRSRDPQFWTVMDRRLSVELSDHHSATGAVLQIVRLPRLQGGQLMRGVALIAPGA